MPGMHMLCFHPNLPELYLTSRREPGARRLMFDSATVPPTPKIEEATALSLPTNFTPNVVTLSRNGRTMALTSFFEGRTFITDLGTPEWRLWLKAVVQLTLGG